MKIEKFKVLLYLKKSGMDKNGKAPIMGRITVNRTMAQLSCKLSCTPSLWNPRASRLEGKRYPFPIAEHESCSYRSHHHLQVGGNEQDLFLPFGESQQNLLLIDYQRIKYNKNVTANDLETSNILFLSQLCYIQRTLRLLMQR